jgi:hypothetical protein
MESYCHGKALQVNKEQLARQIGKQFRLRPPVSVLSPDGKSVQGADDAWTLLPLKGKFIELKNPRTDHLLRLGFDNLREFRTPDFLLTKCNVTLAGNEVKIEPIVEKPQTATSQANVIIEHQEIRATQQRHDYRLLVVVDNTGTKPIADYHVDLEFPSMMLDPAIHHALQVRDRTTKTHSLFRVTAKDHLNNPIYPKDKKIVMSVDYFMNSELYELEDQLFKETARATLYVDGNPPQIAEKPISQLQNI